MKSYAKYGLGIGLMMLGMFLALGSEAMFPLGVTGLFLMIGSWGVLFNR